MIHQEKKILWVSPRAQCLFGVYLFQQQGKDIIRIHNNEEEKDLINKVRARMKEIDKEPKKEKSIPKTKKAKNMSVIQKLEQKEKKARSYKDSNGFALGNIKVTPVVEKWCKEKGYVLHSKSIKWD